MLDTRLVHIFLVYYDEDERAHQASSRIVFGRRPRRYTTQGMDGWLDVERLMC